MSIKTFRQALNEALHLEMSRDKTLLFSVKMYVEGLEEREKKMLGVGHSE